MSQQPPPNAPQPPPATPDPASIVVAPPTNAELLQSPQVQDAIAQVIRELPDLLKRKWTAEAELERHQSSSAMVWTFAIVVIVLTIVAFLVFAGKISADSTTFLIGTIVGSVFSFIFKWFSLKD